MFTVTVSAEIQLIPTLYLILFLQFYGLTCVVVLVLLAGKCESPVLLVLPV